MEWSEGDRWAATVQLDPAGSSVVEYKYVVSDAANHLPIRWQEGPNLTLSLGGSRRLEAEDSWCQGTQLRRRFAAQTTAANEQQARQQGVPEEVCAGQPLQPQQQQTFTSMPAHTTSNVVTFTRSSHPSSIDITSAPQAPAQASSPAVTSITSNTLHAPPPPSSSSSAHNAVAALRGAFSPVHSSHEDDSDDYETAVADDGSAAAVIDDDEDERALAAAAAAAAAFLGLPLDAHDAAAAFAPVQLGAGMAVVDDLAWSCGGCVGGAVDPLVAALLSDDCELCCAYVQDAISSCGGGSGSFDGCPVPEDDDDAASYAEVAHVQPAAAGTPTSSSTTTSSSSSSPPPVAEASVERQQADALSAVTDAVARCEAMLTTSHDPAHPDVLTHDRALAAAQREMRVQLLSA